MANSLPKTRAEMRRANYKFTGAAPCRSCNALIEWWETTNGRKMPFDPAGEHEDAVTHFATCPNADRHRTPKGSGQRAAAPGSRAPRPTAQQPMAGTPAARPIFERELQVLMNRSGGCCAVLLYPDDAASFAYSRALDPEEVRNSLISAANHVRDAVRRDRAQTQGGR